MEVQIEHSELTKKRISDRIDMNKKRIRIYKSMSYICYISTGVSLSWIIFAFGKMDEPIRLLVISYFILFFIFGIFMSKRSKDLLQEVLSDENELELTTNLPIDRRAEKLFKAHQFELKRYYDQTLNHNRYIFFVGIFCILLGFSIMGYTVYAVSNSSASSQLSEKIVIASLGTVGSIMSEFIAVIYLKMFSGVMHSLTEFHSKLVYTNHLHFSNFMTAKINNDELREETYRNIALYIAKSTLDPKTNDATTQQSTHSKKSDTPKENQKDHSAEQPK